MKNNRIFEKINRAFLKKCSAALTIGITVLGFSAGCKKSDKDDNDNIIAPEYGVPRANFVFNGEVLSAETEEAISGIRVALDYDTVYTDVDGKFKFGNYSNPDRKSFPMDISDVDGDKNGKYRDMKANIVLENPTFTGSSGYLDGGKTENNIEIRLNPD